MRNTTNNALVRATIEVVSELGRGEFLSENPEKELESMFNKVRKSFIGFYEEDLADEILVDAWLYVFKQNGAKNIRMFDGHNPNTGKSVSIVSYLYFLLRNSVINHSKSRKNQYLNERGINNFEFESDSDAIGRAMFSSSVSQVKSRDNDYIKYLQDVRVSCINTLREIQTGKKLVNNKERNIKAINNKIKKIDQELQREEDKQTHLILVEQEDWNTEDINSEMVENRSLGSLVSRLTLTDNQVVILLGLLEGIKVNEISDFLEVDKNVIKKEIESIKESVSDLSEDLAICGDDTIESIIDSYRDIKFKNYRESEKRQRVCKSYKNIIKAWKDIINKNNDKLYNQIDRIYSKMFGRGAENVF